MIEVSWYRVKAECEKQIEISINKCTTPFLSHEETEFHRARLAAFREVLKLGEVREETDE